MFDLQPLVSEDRGFRQYCKIGFTLESNASMVWYWYNCNCCGYFPDFKNWWNAVVPTEFSSKTKVLPRTTQIATAIGFIYFY